ncbi:hypothetical protein E6O75_ATG09997 [Venturia nashicola]|uniref:Uncharacterized protein n=1 Tax=Venturia nashicola TaxID=86259 RepID=A0A4Z1NEN4_9PEZI|nr:hypothetical protein E6O75_ATG09997 [Venturia nashicola]
MSFPTARNSTDTASTTTTTTTTSSLQKPKNQPSSKQPSLFTRLFHSPPTSPTDREKKQVKRQQRKTEFNKVRTVQNSMMVAQVGNPLT